MSFSIIKQSKIRILKDHGNDIGNGDCYTTVYNND